MEIVEFLDKAGLPVLILLFYVIVYIYRNKIFRTIKKRLKNKDQIDSLKLLASNFKFKIGNWWYSVIFSMIIAIIMDIIIILIFKIPMKPYSEPLWFAIIFRSLFNPVSEEVLIRGFIFGAFFLTIFKLVEKLRKRPFNPTFLRGWIVVALFLQTYIFASSHENPALFNWTIRLSSGILYGLLYLLHKRNLLPPVVAHITHNLVITLTEIV